MMKGRNRHASCHTFLLHGGGSSKCTKFPMSRGATGTLMASMNTSASNHCNGVIPSITTPPVLWTGGLQVIEFKVEPAVYLSSKVVPAPPIAAAMLQPNGSPVI